MMTSSTEWKLLPGCTSKKTNWFQQGRDGLGGDGLWLGHTIMRGQGLPQSRTLHAGGQNHGWLGPAEEVLKSALMDFSKQRLPVKLRLASLKSMFGLDIKPTTLHNLNKKFNVPSSRRKMPQDVADQLVLNKMSDLNDQAGRWGVQRTMDALAKDGTPVPRRVIHEVMHDNEPDAVDARFPGKKKISHAKLSSIGPFHEVNCDGHDKLGMFTLQMGPVTLPIYGMKDKWSDTALRQIFAPELDADAVPSFVALLSTRNIPIEGAWHWFREQTGRTLFHHVTQGKMLNIFNPNNEVHIKLFNWIWPPIIQQELDKFRDSWNMHTV
ncbi:hypothetical protein A0H81_06561 [Grifola frondosa]|uniref:Uncharacterized protein n=1 Tax=Grifola frondosa TaxID=5627 RepID=A0A1C7MBV2_GRIFR|nr:hypothetical protein A0H81_06561 [Grifola frondosa]